MDERVRAEMAKEGGMTRLVVAYGQKPLHISEK
jgi:hypothetical protein